MKYVNFHLILITFFSLRKNVITSKKILHEREFSMTGGGGVWTHFHLLFNLFLLKNVKITVFSCNHGKFFILLNFLTVSEKMENFIVNPSLRRVRNFLKVPYFSLNTSHLWYCSDCRLYHIPCLWVPERPTRWCCLSSVNIINRGFSYNLLVPHRYDIVAVPSEKW